MKADIYDLQVYFKGINRALLILEVEKACIANLNKEQKGYEVEIRKKRKRRSLSANAYLWQLCGQIASRLQTTKEEVYRDAIRKVGVYTAVTVAVPALERLRKTWGANKIGWFVDHSGVARHGMIDAFLYHGSSVYTTEEMGELIDHVVDEAQELGIDTMTPREIGLLKSSWINENES